MQKWVTVEVEPETERESVREGEKEREGGERECERGRAQHKEAFEGHGHLFRPIRRREFKEFPFSNKPACAGHM